MGFEIFRNNAYDCQGLCPSQKKVEAILQIKAPTTRKQLRQFIGMVNYYRDMWPLRSHLLAPLSLMTSAKVKWKWTPECQDSFEKMKAIMAMETLVTFPDFTKEFEIHTDASKLALCQTKILNGGAGGGVPPPAHLKYKYRNLDEL
jgi:hypothetical protein